MRALSLPAIALALLVAPDAANAAKADCNVFSALMAERQAERHRVTLGWNREGVILQYRGKPMRLPAFDNCDMTDDEIDCYWRFADREEAMARLEQARIALAPCMPMGLTSREWTGSEALQYLGVYKASIEKDDFDAEFQLDGIEFFDDDGGPSRFWVSVSVETDSY